MIMSTTVSKDMVYAPVLIHTLNRKNHLSRCIKSLEQNRWAKYTEVFISLDYPPSEKYQNGYLEVTEYLDKLEKHNCFREVHIFRQNKNLGPLRNGKFLVDVVSPQYDRWIVSEDDTEFSSNFLEYMDITLDMFKEESRITAICGCSDFQYQIPDLKETVYCSLSYLPYGIGIWRDRYVRLSENITSLLLSPESYTFKSMCNLARTNPLIFRHYVWNVLCNEQQPQWSEGRLTQSDCNVSLYNFLSDSYCLHPIRFKSHSFGFDGTGINMKADSSYDPDNACPLDLDESFELIYDESNIFDKGYQECLRDIYKKYTNIRLSTFLKVWIIYFMFCISGHDGKKVRNNLKRLREILRWKNQ